MPIFGQVAAAILLLAVCGFFPGFFFVRRLRWTPLEKLCGSIGLSLVFLYAAVFAVYCFGPVQQRPAYWAIAATSALPGILTGRDAWRLFRSFRVRHTLLAFGFLLAFTFAMLAMIRVYSGAGWAADWAEHFQRSLFFLDRLPAQTQFIDIYALPARPPMQNVLAAFFLGLTADRFEIFQAIFGVLNTLMFLPCVLLMPALGFRKRRALVPLVVLFAANPAVMQNVTYTWTKALTAFYVILAIALYLSGWRKNDRVRTAAAFLALAAGVLVHYSAGPYVVVLGLHYLVRLWRERPRRWRDLAIVTLPAILLLATWFGWSFKVYGAKTTLASNTSVSTAESDPVKNTGKIIANVFDTVVPTWMRGATPPFDQPNADGRLRDQAFLFYQVNLIFALGAVGGPLVLWLLYRRLIRGEPGRERLFWRVLIPACIVLGIAVVGERDPQGVSHLTLLALQIAGLALLASAFSILPSAVRWIIIAGCCVDFGLGVFLHARVQSLENTPRREVFASITYQGGGQFGLAPQTANALYETAWRNWLLKRRTELFSRWLRELPRGHEADPLFQAGWPPAEQQLKTGLQLDAENWGGWRARHGGSLEHLGDHAAGQSGTGSDVAAALLVLLFVGCLWPLARQAMAPAPALAKATATRSAAASRRGGGGTSRRARK
jgi:4-amino-4-deoxy-L-arabinose transferase-like glycosyltransferase